MKIGSYEIHTIETGSFALDGGAMFGIVPKSLWDKTNPADELNRIEMRARCLLLIDRAANRVVLVDNGMGSKWAEKFAKIYKIDNTIWSLETELAEHGLKTGDVTDIVSTHLHFDHMGGTTKRVGNELVPAFENARVWLQEQNWKTANQPNEKDRASYLSENFEIYRGDSKLQLVEVADGKSVLLYCADLVPTASHVKPACVMGYDCFPLTTIEEKKKVLAEAAERGMILFFEHCPSFEAASVHHDGKDFAVKQAYRF